MVRKLTAARQRKIKRCSKRQSSCWDTVAKPHDATITPNLFFTGACKVFLDVCCWFPAAVMSLTQTADTRPWPQTTFAPPPAPEAPLISPFFWGRKDGRGEGLMVGRREDVRDGGWKGTGKQMASYLSLLCEGCHSNRLMQGSGKEKKRQRQSRKGLGKTIGPRATGQICRLGHNRWSFFNRRGQLLQATCAAVPCFKRSHALFTYDSANG